jgi:hypothetical protein
MSALTDNQNNNNDCLALRSGATSFEERLHSRSVEGRPEDDDPGHHQGTSDCAYDGYDLPDRVQTDQAQGELAAVII